MTLALCRLSNVGADRLTVCARDDFSKFEKNEFSHQTSTHSSPLSKKQKECHLPTQNRTRDLSVAIIAMIAEDNYSRT